MSIAGIMSLPHAMAVLGLAFGTSLLMLIYWLAYYTLKKLIKYDTSRPYIAFVGSVKRCMKCRVFCNVKQGCCIAHASVGLVASNYIWLWHDVPFGSLQAA